MNHASKSIFLKVLLVVLFSVTIKFSTDKNHILVFLHRVTKGVIFKNRLTLGTFSMIDTSNTIDNIKQPAFLFVMNIGPTRRTRLNVLRPAPGD